MMHYSKLYEFKLQMEDGKSEEERDVINEMHCQYYLPYLSFIKYYMLTALESSVPDKEA